jgi:hypothetical protein
MKALNKLNVLKIKYAADSSKESNELVPHKSDQILDYASNNSIFKTDCAPWSWFKLTQATNILSLTLDTWSLSTLTLNLFFRTFLTAEVSLNHSGFLDHIQWTHTVGLLWTSDQPIAEASTYTGQHNVETQ